MRCRTADHVHSPGSCSLLLSTSMSIRASEQDATNVIVSRGGEGQGEGRTHRRRLPHRSTFMAVGGSDERRGMRRRWEEKREERRRERRVKERSRNEGDDELESSDKTSHVLILSNPPLFVSLKLLFSWKNTCSYVQDMLDPDFRTVSTLRHCVMGCGSTSPSRSIVSSRILHWISTIYLHIVYRYCTFFTISSSIFNIHK